MASHRDESLPLANIMARFALLPVGSFCIWAEYRYGAVLRTRGLPSYTVSTLRVRSLNSRLCWIGGIQKARLVCRRYIDPFL